MKLIASVIFTLTIVMTATAQSPQSQSKDVRPNVVTGGDNSLPGPTTTAPNPAVPAGSVKIPDVQTNELRFIELKRRAILRELDLLEQQRVIVAQRAALELKLDAEQYDKLQLGKLDEDYYFVPKKP